MKHVKKLFAFALTLVMAFAIALPAFAADGQGTLTVTNATAGQTYKAYKVFNAVYADNSDISKGVVYTIPAAQESLITEGAPFTISTAKADNGEKILVRKTGATDAQILQWMKDNYSKFDATGTNLPVDDTKNTASATLPYGYYYVTSSLGSVITIDSVNDAVEIVDKNESTPNGPDKDITAEDSAVNENQDQTGIEVKNNDASVGSVESFQVDFDATNWVQDAESDATAGTGTGTKTKVTEYNFVDTPTGLAIDASTVKVFVNYDNNAQEEITSKITDITVDSSTGKLTFTIPWVDDNGNSLYTTQTEGSELIPVHVTYNATVLDSAATAVAPNEVEVKYNHDKSIGKSTTNTYTYKFDLKKTGENSQALEGAEFQLFYYKDGVKTGEALTFTFKDGVYHFDPAGTVTNIAPKIATEGADAKASIVGLDNAQYILVEVVVPDGYNKAADKPVTSVTRVDVAGDPTLITVENNKGTELPSTGGIGTTIFYIVGGAMVIGGGVFLLTKRRMSAE